MPTKQLELPEVYEADSAYSGRFMAVIFNDDHTPYEAVVGILMQATGCGVEEAAIETWEAHHHGKSNVHFSTQDACCAVASIISSIGVKTEVRPEWEE